MKMSKEPKEVKKEKVQCSTCEGVGVVDEKSCPECKGAGVK